MPENRTAPRAQPEPGRLANHMDALALSLSYAERETELGRLDEATMNG